MWKYLFVIALFMIGCRNTSKIPQVNIEKLTNNEEILIKDWRVAGPFPAKKGKSKFAMTSLDLNDLNMFGMIDDSLNAADFLAINKENLKNDYKLPANFINKQIHTDFYYIDFKKMYKNKANTIIGNVYLCCIIESKTEQQAVFLTGSNDGMKIWLNKKLLYKIDIPRQIQKYQDFIPAHLKKGKNFLFVKVNNRGGDWYFRLGVSNNKYAEKKYNENIVSNFLEYSLIDKGDKLKFNAGILTRFSPFEVNIVDSHNNIILKNNYANETILEINLDNFSEGLYVCKLIFPTYVLEEKFYYGDIQSYFRSIKKNAGKFRNKNERIKINIDALTYRFNHLLQHYKKYSKNWDSFILQQWQKKTIFIAYELENIVNRLIDGKESFANISGTHIRGYRSIIDGKIQYDLIFIPSGYEQTGKPLPLVVQIPVFSEKPRPFLEGYPLADIARVEVMSALAEKYGYAILWPGARIFSKINIHPIGTKAVFESMENLKKDYKIDKDRIYLYGVCSGARSALLFAARFSSIFAAVGLDRPMFDISQSLPPSAKKWAAANNMFNFSENLINTPMYIIHGEKDTHAPFKETVKFEKLCKKTGLNFKYDFLKGVPTHLFYNESLAKIFGFFNNKTLVKYPHKIFFSTAQLKYNTSFWLTINKISPMEKAVIKAELLKENLIEVETKNVFQYGINPDKLKINKEKPLKIITNGQMSYNDLPGSKLIIVDVENLNEKTVSKFFKNNKIEGPIMDAFSDRFIVVEGTIGSVQDHLNIHNQVNVFRKAWRKSYFSDCLYKKDVEITEYDIQNSNLILFGNQLTNRIIKEIINQIPLTIKTDHIAIGRNEFHGSKLSFSMIYPNPLNTDKYIVIIGANNVNFFQLGESDLSLNGWLDYSVWNFFSANNSNEYSGGYFDMMWQ